MIHFFTTRSHAYTLELYLQIWGRDLRDRIAPPRYYEELPFRPRLNPGVYIFTDLERLGPVETELRSKRHHQLLRPAGRVCCSTIPRKRCADTICSAPCTPGLNRFNARKIDDGTTSRLNSPLFLRNDSDHKAPSRRCSMMQAKSIRPSPRRSHKAKTATSFYSVQYVDTRTPRALSQILLLPRRASLHSSPPHSHPRMGRQNTSIRSTRLRIEEEMTFCNPNRTPTQLERIFDIANVDYGRIDYAVPSITRFKHGKSTPTPTITGSRPARSRSHVLQTSGIFAAQFARR